MADPGFQVGIGAELGVHQTTVSKVIHEVMAKVSDKADQWIRFPATNAAIHKAQNDWSARFNFPKAFGVIDCTHVTIEKPREFGDEYVNRKGKTTINVQATCDAAEQFTSVEVHWPGSVHDSRILKNSPLFDVMNRSATDGIILGDEGYGISPWLMVPYRNAESEHEKGFNRLFTKERVIIERCFGMLKRRFPILGYKIRLDVSHTPTIILCCVILHNVAKHLNDPIPNDEYNFEPEEETVVEQVAETSYAATTVRRLGNRRRAEIAAEISRL